MSGVSERRCVQLLRVHLVVFVMGFLTAVPLCALERQQSAPVSKSASAPAAVAVTILSIIPAQAEPGARVVLSGTGFGSSSTVFLGSVEIPVTVSGGKSAEFVVPPELDAGLYAFYLKRSDGAVGRSYNFTVLPLRPVLSSLSPSAISSCAIGKERDVTAVGSNFTSSSMLFLDGAVVPSTFVSSEAISFPVPSLPGGLHHVQVKNSPENSSVPLTLSLETRPEIDSVTIGSEFVNYYELLIVGRNFTRQSVLYVDGVQLGGNGGKDMAEREKLIYADCSKLVYQRHPYSPVKKDFLIQIINPGGEGSQVVTVSAP